ncbi:Phenol hydroxylase P1 protein [Georgfuchsia toluolica]|uniref:Phenol hydroxylase P1 protein n=1 Tax=Georgfuchsia toluolica TaxID=424218 RepID=A0A916J7H3_9PROT|nr:aromatic/alkene monooxygenase hydroxylase subunit beta [Georgfuchsia toluolica]CAG4885416.1 Phenol hydroxylase P1 protein [Georgfuchsia toluolica]CAG4885440.1 Phenol hydroxylase P1 protein [Georgfuchsia toluolica]
MQIDLRTVSIKPLRQTFDHVAARIGGDKPASRYQEGTICLQAEANFHYRPLWAPEYEIFDARRTKLKMRDWYAFKDPRQFYYGTYTITRARMQETAESDFDFVEERGLAANYPEAARKIALEVLLPLRHVAWGSNMNNSFCAAYGFGTAITQPCLYCAMDQLGIAQYLTRVGLLLDEPAALDVAKKAWMENWEWQGLRRSVEDMLVTQDWFELFVAQNLALDGLLYPLVYSHIDNALSAQAGPAVSMLIRFQAEWYAETAKWVDASIKTAVAESDENKVLVSEWVRIWRERAVEALTPIAMHALGSNAESVMSEIVEQFNARVLKLGLTL